MPALDLNYFLEDRLQTTGYLSESTAAAFGTLGYVGRASGQDFDVRRDAPYAPYDQLNFQITLEHQGDIAAIVLVRVKEVSISIELIAQMLKQLPYGEVQTPWQVPAKDSENLAMIEGWRGEIITYVRFGSDNKISRFYARYPSSLNWYALEKIVPKSGNWNLIKLT
jgi:Ni,Fe-hydrogenase III large subunit